MDRFPCSLQELVRAKADVIVASSQGAARAHAAVKATPVVFVGVADPVALGVVDTRAPRPQHDGAPRPLGEGRLGKAVEALREIVRAPAGSRSFTIRRALSDRA